jgi:hypothetical protein
MRSGRLILVKRVCISSYMFVTFTGALNTSFNMMRTNIVVYGRHLVVLYTDCCKSVLNHANGICIKEGASVSGMTEYDVAILAHFSTEIPFEATTEDFLTQFFVAAGVRLHTSLGYWWMN